MYVVNTARPLRLMTLEVERTNVRAATINGEFHEGQFLRSKNGIQH